MAAVEAALSTGLTLNNDSTSGPDKSTREAMWEGATLHARQVREAVSRALNDDERN